MAGLYVVKYNPQLRELSKRVFFLFVFRQSARVLECVRDFQGTFLLGCRTFIIDLVFVVQEWMDDCTRLNTMTQRHIFSLSTFSL